VEGRPLPLPQTLPLLRLLLLLLLLPPQPPPLPQLEALEVQGEGEQQGVEVEGEQQGEGEQQEAEEQHRVGKAWSRSREKLGVEVVPRARMEQEVLDRKAQAQQPSLELVCVRLLQLPQVFPCCAPRKPTGSRGWKRKPVYRRERWRGRKKGRMRGRRRRKRRKRRRRSLSR
jgi:hypothetical protein